MLGLEINNTINNTNYFTKTYNNSNKNWISGNLFIIEPQSNVRSTKNNFQKNSKFVSFGAHKFINNSIPNFYDDFYTKFLAKHKDKPLVYFIREIFDTTSAIGQGAEKKIYNFPELKDYVVAYLYNKEPLKKELPIKKLQIKFPKYNFSEPFAGNNHDILIMKKINGITNSVNNYIAAAIKICQTKKANREFAKEYFSKLQLFKNFPQTAYDDLLKQIKYLTNKINLIDSQNPNNMMIDTEAKKFHLIDLPSERQTALFKKIIDSSNAKTTKSGMYDAFSLLLDSKFQCYYMDFMSNKEKEETITISKNVIKKIKTAVKKTNLPENEDFVIKIAKYVASRRPLLNKQLYKRYDDFLELYKDIIY